MSESTLLQNLFTRGFNSPLNAKYTFLRTGSIAHSGTSLTCTWQISSRLFSQLLIICVYPCVMRCSTRRWVLQRHLPPLQILHPLIRTHRSLLLRSLTRASRGRRTYALRRGRNTHTHTRASCLYYQLLLGALAFQVPFKTWKGGARGGRRKTKIIALASLASVRLAYFS